MCSNYENRIGALTEFSGTIGTALQHLSGSDAVRLAYLRVVSQCLPAGCCFEENGQMDGDVFRQFLDCPRNASRLFSAQLAGEEHQRGGVGECVGGVVHTEVGGLGSAADECEEDDVVLRLEDDVVGKDVQSGVLCSEDRVDGSTGVAGTDDAGGEARVKGKNWKRNFRRRQNFRQKKQSSGGSGKISQEDVLPVKSGRVTEEDVPVRSRVSNYGFFSGCDQELQQRLRDSRARLLVAENERKLKLEEAKMRRMTGSLGSVVELAKALKQVEDLRRVSKDTAVGGWARTLCESVQKSVSAAVSTPESVPSLEEVGFGVDATTASGVDARKVEYKMRKELLEASYEAADSYFPEDRVADFRDLDEEFGDVLGKPDDIVKRKLRREFFEAGAVTKDQQLAVVFSLIGIENHHY